MFEVTARLKVRNGELEGFKQRAAEMMRQTRALDTKTLRYDWFMSDDATQFEVRESYLDADGLLEHNTHVRDARDQLFRDHAYGHDMTIYGEPSPALAQLMHRMASHVKFNRFSLLTGLGTSASEAGTAVFEATPRLKIRDGQLEGFKQQAAELVRLMGAGADQPLRYDWFLSEDGTECEVREAYVDADALLEHQQQIAEAKMKFFRAFVDGHEMTFYGELSPALAGALQAMGTTYTVFSFAQGLNTDLDVRARVPA